MSGGMMPEAVREFLDLVIPKGSDQLDLISSPTSPHHLHPTEPWHAHTPNSTSPLRSAQRAQRGQVNNG